MRNFIKVFKLSSVIFISFFTAQVAAQIVPDTGPPVDSLFNPFPETGAWFANDGSNTGFFLEFVNRQVGGAYFGSDSEGNNVWLTFAGSLEPLNEELGPDFEPGWTLTANLNQASDTGCILDCPPGLPPAAPTSNTVGEIAFTFIGRNTGQFSIDGSDSVDIIPLFFGVSAAANNPDEPLEFLPELQGTWVIAEGSPTAIGDNFARPSATNLGQSSAVIDIGLQQVTPLNNGNAFLQVTTPITGSTDQLFNGAEINCLFSSLGDDPDNQSPDCAISGPNIPAASGIGLPFEFISDVRFIGLMPTGDDDLVVRFEAFRLAVD